MLSFGRTAIYTLYTSANRDGDIIFPVWQIYCSLLGTASTPRYTLFRVNCYTSEFLENYSSNCYLTRYTANICLYTLTYTRIYVARCILRYPIALFSTLP